MILIFCCHHVAILGQVLVWFGYFSISKYLNKLVYFIAMKREGQHCLQGKKQHLGCNEVPVDSCTSPPQAPLSC